jgi:hypothetical protein
MTHCDLTYGEVDKGHNETKVIENFLPQHRSFNLHPLQVGCAHWLRPFPCYQIEVKTVPLNITDSVELYIIGRGAWEGGGGGGFVLQTSF